MNDKQLSVRTATFIITPDSWKYSTTYGDMNNKQLSVRTATFIITPDSWKYSTTYGDMNNKQLLVDRAARYDGEYKHFSLQIVFFRYRDP